MRVIIWSALAALAMGVNVSWAQDSAKAVSRKRRTAAGGLRGRLKPGYPSGEVAGRNVALSTSTKDCGGIGCPATNGCIGPTVAGCRTRRKAMPSSMPRGAGGHTRSPAYPGGNSITGAIGARFATTNGVSGNIRIRSDPPDFSNWAPCRRRAECDRCPAGAASAEPTWLPPAFRVHRAGVTRKNASPQTGFSNLRGTRSTAHFGRFFREGTQRACRGPIERAPARHENPLWACF